MLRLRVSAILLVICWLSSLAPAADQVVDFVHALQEAGYGDTAVEYMQQLEKQQRIPEELKDTWDLEFYNSYEARARNAFGEKEATASKVESKKYLDKFLKEHPNHPDVAKAVLGSALAAQRRGLALLASAKINPNKEQAGNDTAEARAAFEEAKPRFQQALERFKKKLDGLKVPGKNAKKRETDEYETAVSNFIETRFQVSLTDVYIARTMADRKDPIRVKLLQGAAKEFDSIFQKNRENIYGLAAHMWNGKVEEEQGNVDKAVDIYDEVASYGPNLNELKPDAPIDPLFAELHLARLQLLLKQKKFDDFDTEAKTWLDAYKKSRKNVVQNFYQGIQLEYVKFAIVAVEKATGKNKLRYENDITTMLKDMVKIRSDYQLEALQIFKGRNKSAGQDPKTMEEALALGDNSLRTKDWADAEKMFVLALSLAPKNAPPATLTEVKGKLAFVRFNIARELYTEKKYAQSLEIAEKVAVDPDAGDVGSVSSAMSVQAAFGLYLEAHNAEKPDKEAEATHLARMNKNAETTIAKWPGKPEADDSRMLLAQAYLVMGKLDEAVKAYDGVNIKSEKYAAAKHSAGRTLWYRYVQEKQKSESDRNQEQMIADRKKGVELLLASFAAQQKAKEPGKPFPKALLDTQLLLGEIELEGNQPDKSVQYLQSLVDVLSTEKSDQFDSAVTLRVFTAAVRAYSAKNDLAKAGEVGLKMIEMGPDTPQVNNVLMEFAKLLDLERKKAVADVTTKPSAQSEKKLADTNKMLGTILSKLMERKQLSAVSLLLIAETFANIGDLDRANQQYSSLLNIIEKEPNSENGKALAKAEVRILTNQIDLKRNSGDFDGARESAKAIIAKNPNALEPRLLECRILQDKAEKSNDAADFNAAATSWAQLRAKLGTKRSPEYYEVLYNSANCLVFEAEQLKAKKKEDSAAKALLAEKMLNSVLATGAASAGPDVVAKYKELAAKAALLQGRKETPKESPK